MQVGYPPSEQTLFTQISAAMRAPSMARLCQILLIEGRHSFGRWIVSGLLDIRSSCLLSNRFPFVNMAAAPRKASEEHLSLGSETEVKLALWY